ncbi:MAG: hypothetical protein WBF89_00670 [Steroidobacteraceae bacterium]|jgi:hypothetical protein
MTRFNRLLALLALAATLPLAAAGAATDRPTPSIGASFDAFWTAAHDQPFERQEALWDRLIEQPRQDLYASVVWETRDYPGWKESKQRTLQRRFAQYPRVSDQILAAAKTLESSAPSKTAQFRRLFPDAPARPSIQWVLAPNFDAKSGLLGDGTPVLAFAVDSLVLEHADMDVLFPHELFHLYHANHAGIENDGVMPDANLTLPLFAEGLATYVSSMLCAGRSDGQLLLQDDLGALPVARLPEVATRFLADADQKAIDPAHPQAFGRWFMGASSNYQPDLPNRAGYWLGLQIVREMRHRYSLQEMASWPPSKAQQETRSALLTMADPGRAPGAP